MFKQIQLIRNHSKMFNNFQQLLILNNQNVNYTNSTTNPLPNLKIVQTNTNLIKKRFLQSIKNEIKCWKCGVNRRNLTDLFCEQCNFIQNPSNTTNYYKIFELNENYLIDSKLLTEKYRKMQSLLHPDKFTNKTKEEKTISDEFSSLINKAYKILQNPLDRAIHLLKLHGEIIEENQQITDDQNFLMEIMELNEQVENADTPEKLRELNKTNQLVLQEIIKEINENFQENDLRKAKQNIIKMKYYNSLDNYINNLMRERGIID